MSTATIERACLLHDTARAALACVLAHPEEAWPHVSRVPAGAWPDEETRATALAMGRLIKRRAPISELTLTHECAGDVSAIFITDLWRACESGTGAEHYARELINAHFESRIRTAGVQGDTAALTALLAERDAAIPTETRQALNVAAWCQDEAPPMVYVFGDRLPVDTVSGMIAKGGGSKSWFTMMLGVSLASGRALFPSFAPARPRKVLWFSGEDPDPELHRRFKRIQNAHELTADDMRRVVSNLVPYHESFPLANIKDEVFTPSDDFAWLRKEVIRHQPGMIIIDPLAAFEPNGGKEIDNDNRTKLVWLLKSLLPLVDGGTTVWLCHHVAKAREKDLDSASARGGTALRDGARYLLAIEPLTASEAQPFGVDDNQSFLKVSTIKSNWTASGGKPVYVQRGAGGVLTEVDLEGRRDATDAELLDRLARRVAALVGDNRDDLSVTDFVRGKEGKELREQCRGEFGPVFGKADRVREAFEMGAELGYMTLEESGSTGRTKVIPRGLSAILRGSAK